MSKKMQFDREDYLKANRKLSREEEIKTHGRPAVSYTHLTLPTTSRV